ncbi:MAG: hypothetical protein ACREOL_03080 [Candidatus Dormibacteria bacterium]
MGLMDKIKGQAEQVAVRAQEGSGRVHAKLDAVQDKLALDGLYRDLGSAYYAELRGQGGHEQVEHAVAALDAHGSDEAPK